MAHDKTTLPVVIWLTIDVSVGVFIDKKAMHHLTVYIMECEGSVAPPPLEVKPPTKPS